MSTTTRTPGRPRDTRIDVAVLDAVSTVLDEEGYHALTIEDVARRGRVSKPAIYRRWPDRQRLVLAELQRRLDAVEAPDTSCTLCDLHESLSLFAQAFTRAGAGTLAQLIADVGRDDELRAELLTALVEPQRAAVRRTLTRAQERGDLDAGLDLSLTVDALSSLVFYRLLFGPAPLSEAEIEAAVTTLLRGIASDFASLSAEYTAHVGEHEAGRASR